MSLYYDSLPHISHHFRTFSFSFPTVNPVIPEAVNQTAFQVIGNDLTITMAAEAGQLQLNAMEPVIIYNLLSSLRMLTNACDMFTERCIKGITANVDKCEKMVRDSIGIVTAFSPFIGYEKSSQLAKEALQTGRSVVDMIKEEKLLDENKIESIMRPANLTGPSSLFSESQLKVVDKTGTHLRHSSFADFRALEKETTGAATHVRYFSLADLSAIQ